MHEILRHLNRGELVLDLGSGDGSFPHESYPVRTIRLDLECPKAAGGQGVVQADAGEMPFRDGVFKAVIANHSLEHCTDLHGVLTEIRRVARHDGCLFVSVPDAGTLTDLIYRWIARGGSHVNMFWSPTQVSTLVESVTGLKHIGTRPLYSSLNFLNRYRVRGWPRRKLYLLGGGMNQY